MKDKEVFDIILSLAEKEENIRAVLLEGSRANPNTMPDKWQDFDIVYVTSANAPYIDGTWIKHKLLPKFSEIAVKQIPDNGDSNDVYTWLIQFADGLRIDLTFNSLEFLSRSNVKLESATKVLMDKDNRFADVPPPNESDYFPKRPTEQEFLLCCNEFWWTSSYVAKALARGQTLHALEMLNECVRHEYTKMLTWFAGDQTGYAINFGKHSWNVGKYTSPEFYEPLIKSYPHAVTAEIRTTLNSLLIAFTALAEKTAKVIGFCYDADEGERTMRFLREFYGGIVL